MRKEKDHGWPHDHSIILTEHHLRGFQMMRGVDVQSHAVPLRKQIQTYFQPSQRPLSSTKQSSLSSGYRTKVKGKKKISITTSLLRCRTNGGRQPRTWRTRFKQHEQNVSTIKNFNAPKRFRHANILVTAFRRKVFQHISWRSSCEVSSRRWGGKEEEQRRESSGSKTWKTCKGIYMLNLRKVWLVADPGIPEELPTLRE